MDLNLIQQLKQSNNTKVVLLVIDGLGGLPHPTEKKTELETAHTPFLDQLAGEGICGLHQPVRPGVTPGSGAGHLALFGYDPVCYEIGRGVLSALGSGFDLDKRDVAARGNFCTIDDQGLVTDRRAGRIATEKNKELCEILRQIELPGVELFVETVKEHRFLFVLRGDGLSGEIADTDPQQTGKEPLPAQAKASEAKATAELAQQFLDQARQRLAEHSPANMVLMRGFAKLPDWPTFEDVYGLRGAAVADYPMYRGVAKLLGMQTLETTAPLPEKLATVRSHWDDFDFFFVHVKPTDSSAEDGDFDRKVAEIERVDEAIPELIKLNPDVILVTGDHSTPATLKSHSWHPVPVLLRASTCRPDLVLSFGEQACLTGSLGPRIPGCELMPLALAHAQRMSKFGA
jgi:2,3-bisphosphoglycerate-independent phosphoglycerate mutase